MAIGDNLIIALNNRALKWLVVSVNVNFIIEAAKINALLKLLMPWPIIVKCI